MIDHGQQSDYTKFYVLRQEQIVIEQQKKIIDLEVKMTMLIENANNLGKKYEECLITIENQKEIINQATVSIEDLSNKKIENEKIIKDFTDRLNQSDETNRNIVFEKNNIISELNMSRGRVNDLEREMKRLNEELNILSSAKSSKKTANLKDENF